jgi:hypothetical protein
MADASEKTPVSDVVRTTAKDLAVGAAIGLGLYVVWVIGHSILFAMSR